MRLPSTQSSIRPELMAEGRPKGSLGSAEPFGLESFDLEALDRLKAELLEPNGVNKYVIEFMNRGTKLINSHFFNRFRNRISMWI